MFNQYIILRRSSVPGKIPNTSSLELGEIAINTYDGLIFMKKSGSQGEEIISFTNNNYSGSFTGSFNGNATSASYAVTASYIDGYVTNSIYNTFTSSYYIDSASFNYRIENILIPTGSGSSENSPVTVNAATTTVLPRSPLYNNGTNGVGAFLSASISGTLGNIDGVTLTVGDHFLVKNQANSIQNGVYDVVSTGSASGFYLLSRSLFSDETSELDSQIVIPSFGTTNRGAIFAQTTNNPTIGTDNIIYSQQTNTLLTQTSAGTQAIYQIPWYNTVARQLSKGSKNFKYINVTSGTNITTSSLLLTGSFNISGSLNVTNGITGSLLGTSSYATTASYWSGSINNANSASFATTASYALNPLIPTQVSQLANDSGYITSAALSPYLTATAAAATYQPIGSYLTSISGLNISQLTNDSGYITSSALSSYQPVLVSGTNIKTINGTSILGAGDITIGGVPALTSGSVLFSDGTTIAQDNANLFWDNTNKRLGLGTANPSYAIHTALTNQAKIGTMILGNWSFASGYAFMGWEGIDQTVGGNYAVVQGVDGTYLNTRTGGNIAIRRNNASLLNFPSTGGTQLLQGLSITNNFLSIPVNTSRELSLTKANSEPKQAFIRWDLSTVDGDILGQIQFNSELSAGAFDIERNAVFIEGQAAGTFTSTSTPGRLVFKTTPSASTTPSTRMTIEPTGNIGINTPSPTCALDVTGGIKTSRTTVTAPAATDGNIFSGTYTPTATGVSNVTSLSTNKSQYMRVGNVVTVSGVVNVTPTSNNTPTSFTLTLPIASNLAVLSDCAGTANKVDGSGQGHAGSVTADTTGNVALVEYYETSGSAENMAYTFTYEII